MQIPVSGVLFFVGSTIHLSLLPSMSVHFKSIPLPEFEKENVANEHNLGGNYVLDI